ncbi:hypothetical protein ABEY41_28440 [Peribacillus butanolivorans]|uniref:hypothetical protein n=1 Tax=Peribacillus butanolivorans TaxID=421767 RepID=UPI003D2DA91E
MINTGELALEFAMVTLTSFFIQNGTWMAPIAKINYKESSHSTIFGEDGERRYHEDLTVTVNPCALGSDVHNLSS